MSNVHELAESTLYDWPYYSLTESFEALTKLTALLPRCGVEDITPLLDMTHELGEWMYNAFPRELPSPHR